MLCQCECGKIVKEGNQFIHGHNRPWKGRKRSKEYKIRQSEIMKEKYAKGEIKTPTSPKPRVELDCNYCGKRMFKLEILIRKRNFCNLDCYWKWMKGKTLEELIGDKADAIREKHSKSLMGHVFTEEGRKNISKGLMGRKASTKTKRKQSKAAKKRWSNPKEREKKRLGTMRTFKEHPEIIEKIRKARLKQVFPKEDTLPERLFAELLKNNGFVGWEKHIAIESVCQPDFIFPKKKIAIFVDGDYWHVNPRFYSRHDLNQTQEYNLRRDEEQNKHLSKLGWMVLRFWEYDIKNKVDTCLEKMK